MSGKDDFRHKAEEYKAKAKEGLGKVTGNEQWQAEGKTQKSASRFKQAGEKLKDALTPHRKPSGH
ncbi:CsbD family protein [Nocardiopsis sp. NRRL B-16309]|uniref:CsbD family protein n=1 Tax=Nocardiopsis sp. NRRL B-16309 TaxID=1519494 RepID=UPI0006AED28C|nr:CsbD family protein [Nocardiopsis sp. NRRL B-16309]KOX16713.1 CsbD-like protein [Nocardiopsis sp. NRRL B-16309]